MADTCPICQHAKKQAINTAMREGRHVAVMARQFRVSIKALTDHLEHGAFEHEGLTERPMPQLAKIQEQIWVDAQNPAWRQALHARIRQKMQATIHGPDEPMITHNPLTQFKQAWMLAKDDARMRQQMVDFINQELFSDDLER